MAFALNRALSRPIPLHEAADFFLRVKKAGWNDPPDETGQLEGQFAAPLEQVLQLVTEVAAAKFKLMVTYHIYAESMRGLAQHAIGEVFHEHAEQERAAAEAYLKRAAVLGGGPIHLPEIETPPASADPVGILMIICRAEQEAIALQLHLREMVGERNPLAFQIEQFMIEDQHHHDEAWQLLPKDVQTALSNGIAPPEGAELPDPTAEELPAEGEEVPPEPVAAAPAAPLAAPPKPKTESKPAPKPESKPKEAADLMSLRRAITSGGHAAGQAAEQAAAKKPSVSWHGLDQGLKRLTGGDAAEMAAVSAGAGGGLGALGSAVSDPADKQEVMSDMGPLHRFGVRHPVANGALTLGVPLGLIGAGGMVGQRSLPAAAGLMGAGLLAPAVAEDLDYHLKGREDQALLGKSAGAMAELGAKMRAGAQRVGELYSGSRARELATKSREATERAKFVALDGMRAKKTGLMEGEGRQFAQRFKTETRRARRTGDLANKEYSAVRKTRIGTAGALAVGGGVAVHGKHKRDMQKVDATNEILKGASALAYALRKLGYGGSVEPGQGSEPETAPQLGQEPQVSSVASMEQPGEQPPMATPPGQQTYAPTNYLEAEAVARRAQEVNEAGFYREQAQTAQGQVQSMGQQVQAIQQQLDQLSSQAAESQSQIMAANQEAVQANDQMLNQATLAARMRMGVQALRAQMMEVASQDPEQLATAAGGPTPMDVGQAAAAGAAPADAGAGAPTGLNGETQVTGDQNGAGAQPGAPGSSASPPRQPGTTAGGAGAPSDSASAPEEPGNSDDSTQEKKDSGETTVSIKKGSARIPLFEEAKRNLPFALAGGALAGGSSYLAAKKGKEIPALEQKVDQLRGGESGGFAKSVELANAQLALANAQQARESPGKAALQGGLVGVGLGLSAPTAFRRLHQNIQTIRNA